MYLQPTTIYGSLIPGSEYIRFLVRQGTISSTAAARLKWMDHYAQHRNARLTGSILGLTATKKIAAANRNFILPPCEKQSGQTHQE